jgi:hypothetical protein
MPKKRIQVDTFLEKWICDVCKKGEMEAMNVQLLGNPPRTKHICNECGHTDYDTKSYPNFVYVERKPGGRPAGKKAGSK